MSGEQRQRRLDFLISLAYFGVIIALVYLFLNYALKALWPFVAAFVMAMLLRPAIDKICRRTKLPRSLTVLLLLLFFYGATGLLLTLTSIRLVTQVENMVMQLPSLYSNVIEPSITALFDKLEALIAKLDPDQVLRLESISEQITLNLRSGVTSASSWMVGVVTHSAAGIPRLLINVLVMIIMTYYMALDYGLITRFILKQFSPERAELLLEAKRSFGQTIGKFITSYALIMLITFGELALGLLLIGVDKAILLAGIIAVFDILPVVGSGTVLLPWITVMFLQGNYTRGILLLVLLVVIVVVRNFLEPRIVGDQVGLHPVAALLSMFVGLFLFGPLGIWGLPVTLALLTRLHQAGTIKLFKT